MKAPAIDKTAAKIVEAQKEIDRLLTKMAAYKRRRDQKRLDEARRLNRIFEGR